jgi:epoxyqueuosine reductase QueG
MKEAIRREIERFVAAYAEGKRPATVWRRPLVGFATASDPLFAEFRTVASSSHAMPQDLLAEAKTVVAYFLPFDRSVASGNVAGEAASEGWARAYLETNLLISEIGLHMQRFAGSRGFLAAITPATHNFDPKTLLSGWSHRHVAYAAGLGTFGLHRMLITESGCCGRLGSFVVSAALDPDPRPTEERCLHRRGLRCARCVARCVTGALQPEGFDRHACYRACLRNEALHEGLGKADVCGKCLVGLPCTLSSPATRGPRSPGPSSSGQ